MGDLKRMTWLICEVAAAKVGKKRKLKVRCKSTDAFELQEQETDEHHVLSSEANLQ